MGPASLFTPDLCSDESFTEPGKTHVWALFLQNGNDLDVPQFLGQLGLGDESLNIVIGRLSDTLPTDLVNPEGWTLPALLSLNPHVEAQS